MKWTERQIGYVVADMAEENPLACRALLKITEVAFTAEVPTMAVSLTDRPALLINLDFCRNHLQSENDVKAVLLHEFLHVLLRHTEKYTCNSPLLNLCLDAIINAIIYRTRGMDYAGFFTRFYKWQKWTFLLRPQDHEPNLDHAWMEVHRKIYSGAYGADELHELLDYLRSKNEKIAAGEIAFLGNHARSAKMPRQIGSVLDGIMAKMNGSAIWSSARMPGGALDRLAEEKIRYGRLRRRAWDSAVNALLNECLTPDRRRQSGVTDAEALLPVLNGGDSRALARFMLSPFIPFARTAITRRGSEESTHVYLDVSGSMQQELQAITELLRHFRNRIHRPLWAFSGDVKPAAFIKGSLEFKTSYGTCINPVFEHMKANKVRKALIVTDGFIDPIGKAALKGLNRKGIRVVISASGNTAEFDRRGIKCHQLQKIPNN